MGKKHQGEPCEPERRSFADDRTIDVHDDQAVRFWSERLGASPEEIIEVIKQVGPNTTAVALKLDAPQGERVAPPNPWPPR